MNRRSLYILAGLVIGAAVAVAGVAATVIVTANMVEGRPMASFSCWR